MKKKLLSLGLVSVMALSLVACQDKEAEVAEDTSQAPETTEVTEAEDEVLDCTYNFADYVTLGDYKGIEVTLDGDYEFTMDGFRAYVNEQAADAMGYIKDESQTLVAEDSIVNVDYVGSQGGVAFDGGSAEDQMLDIAANGDVNGNGYIEGFTAGLVGHEVGEEVAYEVKFPDNYGNADLAGQTVTFTFQVNYIAKLGSINDLTEDNISEYFSDYTNLSDFEDGMEADYNKLLEANLQKDTEDAVVAAVYENATITGCPENLLETRLNIYIQMMETYLGGYSLEEYVTGYGMDYDTYLKEMTESLSDAIKQQMVFEAVAAAENMEINQKDYDEYVATVMEYNNITDEEVFYSNYTFGNLDGKEYFKQIYLADEAMKFCVDNAVVNR